MYEMLCRPTPRPVRVGCANPPYQIPLVDGPLILGYRLDVNGEAAVDLFGFTGTIELSDGTVLSYPTKTDVMRLRLPEYQDGHTHIYVRGTVEHRDWFGIARPLYKYVPHGSIDLVDIAQWGTECVIKNYLFFCYNTASECFAVTATDSPKFGIQSNGDVYGNTMDGIFHSCFNLVYDPSDWDTSSVVSAEGAFHHCRRMDFDITKMDLNNVTNVSRMLYDCTSFFQDMSSMSFDAAVRWDGIIGAYQTPMYQTPMLMTEAQLPVKFRTV